MQVLILLEFVIVYSRPKNRIDGGHGSFKVAIVTKKAILLMKGKTMRTRHVVTIYDEMLVIQAYW